MTQFVPKIITFLTDIGIKTHFCSINTPTFLPGISIEKGEIYIDIKKLAYEGDLLHEAGHIAVTTSANCEMLSEDKIVDAGDEVAAILWSYAAAKELGIPLEVLFHKEGYKGDADWLIESFENQSYIGLPLLEWMGMTAGEEKAKELGIAAFPYMIRWRRA